MHLEDLDEEEMWEVTYTLAPGVKMHFLETYFVFDRLKKLNPNLKREDMKNFLIVYSYDN